MTMPAEATRHATKSELEEALTWLRESPRDEGQVELIVRRPAVEKREVLEEAQLDPVEGLVGDNWLERGSKSTEDGSAHPDAQLTLTNARMVSLIARTPDRWPLAGDQLYVDFDLSEDNLPPGTRLQVGSATIEITDKPHTGCGKFVKRFGVDALKFANSPLGREMHLRGIYARVIEGGMVRRGDAIRRLSA
jgi:MOSC domain-containing protein YiiM